MNNAEKYFEEQKQNVEFMQSYDKIAEVLFELWEEQRLRRYQSE